jgi:hypothetical protein
VISNTLTPKFFPKSPEKRWHLSVKQISMILSRVIYHYLSQWRYETDNHAEQLKDVIQDLYQLMVQVNAYDLAGRPTRDVLESSV